jgi:hypothetical protein
VSGLNGGYYNYNKQRPHSSLDYQTPFEFASAFRKQITESTKQPTTLLEAGWIKCRELVNPYLGLKMKSTREYREELASNE